MRKHIVALVLVCIVFIGFVHTGAYADVGGYVFGNGGDGGEADGASGGLEGGLLLKQDAKIGWLGGLGLSATDREEPDDNREYTEEWEGYFAFGIRPMIKNLYLVGTVGGSARDSSETLHIGGEVLEDMEQESEINFTTSGQVRYVWKHLMVGAGYHNRRGVIGGIGFAW